MTRLLSGTAYSLCIIVGSLQMSAQAPQRVDLREWGYKTPEDSSSHFQRQLSSQPISVTNHGETAVGFVTRDRRGLATRELPPLSFHILGFARSGKFISQLAIPTPSWHETLFSTVATILCSFARNKTEPPFPRNGTRSRKGVVCDPRQCPY